MDLEWILPTSYLWVAVGVDFQVGLAGAGLWWVVVLRFVGPWLSSVVFVVVIGWLDLHCQLSSFSACFLVWLAGCGL